MSASTLCFRAAVLLLIAGMIWGLQMAISGDHSAFPAHAHLNLLGFVALFLFGIFYRLNPAVEARRLAVPQVWIWIASTIVAAIGIGLCIRATKSATRLPRLARSSSLPTRCFSLGSCSKCDPRLWRRAQSFPRSSSRCEPSIARTGCIGFRPWRHPSVDSPSACLSPSRPPAQCMRGRGGLCSTISPGQCGGRFSTNRLVRMRSAHARLTILSISGSRAAKRLAPSSVSNTKPQKSPKRS
jgi:hypothetical protein